MACCDLRLEDVPDMGYLHTDEEHNGERCLGRGEVCLRVGVERDVDRRATMCRPATSDTPS